MTSPRHFVIAGMAAATMIAPWAAPAADFELLHRFTGKNDGGYPEAALLFHKDLLYGFAPAGGRGTSGTLFAAGLSRGSVKPLYDFHEPTISEIPVPALFYETGTLFGTTSGGGAHDMGTVYKVDVGSGHHTVLHNLNGTADGGFPQSGVIGSGTTLYGTTQTGGSHDDGVVFKVDQNTGKYTVLYDFGADDADGQEPNGLLAHEGGLYGTTLVGAAPRGNGILFRVDSKTGVETRLYTFKAGTDGVLPSGSLVYHDGLFFGTTAYGGGDANSGTIFQFDPHTGTETVLYRFHGKGDGGQPYAGLVDMDGVLYGTAAVGGLFDKGCSSDEGKGCGTLFAFDLATGKETTVHRFSGVPDGQTPFASLAVHAGVLYGTTLYGGRAPSVNGYGTLFKVIP